VCIFGSSLRAILHHQNCPVEEAFPVLWRWYGAYVPNKQPFSMRKSPLRGGASEPVLVLRGNMSRSQRPIGAQVCWILPRGRIQRLRGYGEGPLKKSSRCVALVSGTAPRGARRRGSSLDFLSLVGRAIL
jgi:hypothetical protein